MKNFFLLIATVTVFVFAGCGGPKKEDSSTVKPGMMKIDLKINGNSLSIVVPDSTVGKLEIVEQSWGATEVIVGKKFQLSISEGKGDITLKKSDITSDEINKVQRFIVDEPNTLVWESSIIDPEVHFYTVEKIGPVFYLIEDIANDHFIESEIQQMLTSAKSIQIETVEGNQ